MEGLQPRTLEDITREAELARAAFGSSRPAVLRPKRRGRDEDESEAESGVENSVKRLYRDRGDDAASAVGSDSEGGNDTEIEMEDVEPIPRSMVRQRPAAPPRPAAPKIPPKPAPAARAAVQGRAQPAMPMVGMAQRIKYKVLRKLQGLVNEHNRLESDPSPRELHYHVRTKELGLTTLRDNRLHAVKREIANLRADIRADGFGDYLAEMPLDMNHYKRDPLSLVNKQYAESIPSRLTHLERSGITRDYIGASRQGYRYGK
jgi:hypothetical protein